MTFLKIIFWLSLFIILYTYILYGVLIWIYLKVRGRYINNTFSNSPSDYPAVSILVACYNEEDFIASKIDNLLKLDYPEDKLEIAFVSDGSDDNTVQLIENHIKNGLNITHFHKKERNGKQHAVNRVIDELSGDIVIFNDCNTWINPESVDKMVRHFQNPEVGVVSGE